jgi:hypothetical protein
VTWSLRAAQPDVIHFPFNLPALGVSWLSVVIGAMAQLRRVDTSVVFTLHGARNDIDPLGPIGVDVLAFSGHESGALVFCTGEAHNLLTERCRVPADKVTYDATRRTGCIFFRSD